MLVASTSFIAHTATRFGTAGSLSPLTSIDELPVVIEIHFLRHVSLNDRLEVFSRNLLIEMTLYKVFHHRLEPCVAAFGLRVHHHADDVEDVSAF